MTRNALRPAGAGHSASPVRPALRGAVAVALAALLPLTPIGTLDAHDAPGAHGMPGAPQGGPIILPTGVDPFSKGSVSAAQSALRLSLTAGSRPGTLAVQLSNGGATSLHVLRDDTPFDDAYGGDFLRIVPTGKGGLLTSGVPYIGPVYRRLPPDASRFLELAPGEVLSAEVDLALTYGVPEDGAYRVAYAGTFQVIDDAGDLRRAHRAAVTRAVRPDTGSVELALAPPPPQPLVRARTPAFDQCSVTQQSMLETATAGGEAATNETLQSLRQTPVGSRQTSPRYTTWFGLYTEPNYDLVTRVFERISGMLAEEVITYRCAPELCSTESTVAYVQPFLREDVNLCPLFFDDRIDDAFRAGTVVHELSHLLRIGNTDDLAYGSVAAAALARNSTVNALANADNYTLFATNDRPPLPMVDDGSGSGPDVPSVPDEAGGDGAAAEFTPLPAGFSATGDLPADTRSAFRVSDVAALQLTSLTGDADLYVFDSPDLSAETLVCSSVEFSREVTIDACDVVGDGERYVVVYAFTAASYRLDAVARDTGGATIAEGAVQLALGDSVSGRLGQRQASLYTAVMPGDIVLNTLEGDSDLYVFRDATFSEDAVVCRSVLSTPTDECALPGTGRVHIGVIGVDADNAFELDIRALEAGQGDEVPGDDDPLADASTGGGGGGGAFGPAWLLLLLAGAGGAMRCRRSATGGAGTGE